jgi:high-affinity iron transporter
MLGAFLITLREGLEMSLIVGILLAYLARTGHRREFAAVWAGVAGAVAISVLAGGVIFGTAGQLEGRSEQLFEGVAMFTAVGVLTYMIFWMRRQAVTIRSELQAKVSEALRVGSRAALVVLTLVAVGREGVETALFLFATVRASSSVAASLGAFLGLGAAVLLGWSLYKGTYKLDLRAFFTVTSGLLLLVGAGLFVRGTGELQEAGILPPVIPHVWDTNALVNQASPAGTLLEAIFGYTSTPSLLQVVFYLTYLVVFGWYYFRPAALPRGGRTSGGMRGTVGTAGSPRS